VKAEISILSFKRSGFFQDSLKLLHFPAGKPVIGFVAKTSVKSFA